MDPAPIFAALALLFLVAWARTMRRCGVLRDQNIVLRAQLAKFDHDGDGKLGGSKTRPRPSQNSAWMNQ